MRKKTNNKGKKIGGGSKKIQMQDIPVISDPEKVKKRGKK